MGSLMGFVPQNQQPYVQRIVDQIEWSPDNTKVAYIMYSLQNDEYSDFRVEIHNASTNQLLLTIPFTTHAPRVFAWRPNGSEILVGFNDGVVQRFDTVSGQSLASYQFPNTFILTVNWSRDGSKFASGGWDNTIRVQDVSNGQIVFELNLGIPTDFGVDQAASWIGWSPDNTRLAVTGWDGTTRIFTTSKWSQLFLLQSSAVTIYWSGWSPDGSKLATGNEDGSISVWNASTGQLSQTLLGHTNTVDTVSWHPDSVRLASASEDGSIKIWNTQNGTLLNSVQTGLGRTITVAWNQNGSQLAYGGQGLVGASSAFAIINPPDISDGADAG